LGEIHCANVISERVQDLAGLELHEAQMRGEQTLILSVQAP
jgi:hypothetical protein